MVIEKKSHTRVDSILRSDNNTKLIQRPTKSNAIGENVLVIHIVVKQISTSSSSVIENDTLNNGTISKHGIRTAVSYM